MLKWATIALVAVRWHVCFAQLLRAAMLVLRLALLLRRWISVCGVVEHCKHAALLRRSRCFVKAIDFNMLMPACCLVRLRSFRCQPLASVFG